MARKRAKPFNREHVLMEVVKCAYLTQASFTFVALAKKCKVSDTRHFRKYVRYLVQEGILTAQRVLFEDGHYRIVLMGQLTRAMPFLYMAEEMT